MLLFLASSCSILNYFSQYCHSVNSLDYTCACTHRVMPMTLAKLMPTTLAYTTPPIMVAQPQHGTVTKQCFPSMKSYAKKHTSISFWIAPSLSRVEPIIFMITSYSSKTLPLHRDRYGTRQTSIVRRQQGYLSLKYLEVHLYNSNNCVSPLSLAVATYSVNFLRCHYLDIELFESRCEYRAFPCLWATFHKTAKFLDVLDLRPVLVLVLDF